MSPALVRLQSSVVVLVALTIAASSGTFAWQRDADWVAPVGAAAKQNPLAGRRDAEPGGRKAFERRCSTCHGLDGRGTRRAPDLTEADVQGQSDGELFWKISGGNTRTGMPTFSFLPPAQRWQIVLHLRAMAAPRP